MDMVLNEYVEKVILEDCIEYVNSLSEDNIIKDKNIIVSTLKHCVSILIEQFQNEAKQYNSISDLLTIMQLYSSLGNSSDKNTILFKHFCRYYIALVPQIDYRESNESNILKCTNISRLYYIAKYIQLFSQQYEIETYSESNVFQLEKSRHGFAFIYANKEISYKHDLLRTKTAIIQKSIRIYDRLPEFKHKTEIFFGNAASDLYDAIFKHVIIIGNINVLSFSEFNEQTDSIEANWVIDVTSAVRKNKGSNFIKGLLYCKRNSNLEKVIFNPYDSDFRFHFRPIIEIKIGGILKYITTGQLFMESTDEIVNNMLPFNDLPNEWKSEPLMKSYANELFRQHASWLEDLIASQLNDSNIHYLRNIKSINCKSLLKKYGETTPGEIDFVISDTINSIIYIVDAKYSKTKFYFQGFKSDKGHYIEQYDKKLSDKILWIESHLQDLSKEMKIKCSGFSVKGVFVTETFIYHSLYSTYPIIPYQYLIDYLKTHDKYCFLR